MQRISQRKGCVLIIVVLFCLFLLFSYLSEGVVVVVCYCGGVVPFCLLLAPYFSMNAPRRRWRPGAVIRGPSRPAAPWRRGAHASLR